MSQNAFALDIGEKYIKVIDVEGKKKSLQAKGGAFHEISFNVYTVTSDEYDKQAAELIRKLTADAGIKKSDVRIVMPDSQSYTRIFDMPFLTDKELISAIKYQADQFIPIPIDKVSLDVHIISKDKKANKTNILLVAAPKAAIDHVVRLTEDAGLIPINIQNECSAVLSLISKRNELSKQPKGLALYINFGNTSTSLYLYDEVANTPLQVHNFSIGYQIFFKEIQANYAMSADQIVNLIERVGFTRQNLQAAAAPLPPGSQPLQAAPDQAQATEEPDLTSVLTAPYKEFTSEIQRFMVSAKELTQKDISALYLIGDGAHVAGLVDELSGTVGVAVQALNLSDIFDKNPVSDNFANDWPLLIAGIGANLY